MALTTWEEHGGPLCNPMAVATSMGSPDPHPCGGRRVNCSAGLEMVFGIEWPSL